MKLSVSVVVPVLDERRYLPGLIECLEAQTRRPEEVLVVDGGSTDGSREWVDAAGRSRPWLRLVENPGRTVPRAMNAGIGAARGDVVARMDAHAAYDASYLAELLAVLEREPAVVGVGGVYDMRGETPWGRAAASVINRPFGLGGAPHRRGGAAGPVDHVGTGAYRRQAMLDVGGFDPGLLANEDFEFDHRLRRSGATIWLQPTARFVSYARPTPRGLARQMWRYGWFKAATLARHPGSVKARQLAPPGLILGLVTLGSVSLPVAGLAGAAYAGVAGSAGALAARQTGASAWRAALAVPLIHLCWGGGLLAGLPRHTVARLCVRGTSPRAAGSLR